MMDLKKCEENLAKVFSEITDDYQCEVDDDIMIFKFCLKFEEPPKTNIDFEVLLYDAVLKLSADLGAIDRTLDNLKRINKINNVITEDLDEFSDFAVLSLSDSHLFVSKTIEFVKKEEDLSRILNNFLADLDNDKLKGFLCEFTELTN